MKKVVVGTAGVWNTLEECSAETGLSVVTISRRIHDLDGDFRMADRVFGLRMKSGGWCLAVMDSYNRLYIPIGWDDSTSRKIRKCDILEARDLTLSFYCGTRFESERG